MFYKNDKKHHQFWNSQGKHPQTCLKLSSDIFILRRYNWENISRKEVAVRRLRGQPERDDKLCQSESHGQDQHNGQGEVQQTEQSEMRFVIQIPGAQRRWHGWRSDLCIVSLLRNTFNLLYFLPCVGCHSWVVYRASHLRWNPSRDTCILK